MRYDQNERREVMPGIVSGIKNVAKTQCKISYSRHTCLGRGMREAIKSVFTSGEVCTRTAFRPCPCCGCPKALVDASVACEDVYCPAQSPYILDLRCTQKTNRFLPAASLRCPESDQRPSQPHPSPQGLAMSDPKWVAAHASHTSRDVTLWTLKSDTPLAPFSLRSPFRPPRWQACLSTSRPWRSPPARRWRGRTRSRCPVSGREGCPARE